MKILSNITKQKNSWLGSSPDGSTVILSSWLSDDDVKSAIKNKLHVNNIFKVKVGNRYYPLGHPLGEWSGYEGTTVIG